MRYHASPWVLAGAFALGVASAADAADYQELYTKFFNVSCWSGCHNGDQNGGMGGSSTAPTAENFYSLTVRQRASNGATPKLRILPYSPGMSFLVDKVLGHVKAGEGDPMNRGTVGAVYLAPGYVHATIEWIRAGAPFTGEFMPGVINEGHPQPSFDAPAVPAGAVRIEGEPFSVGSAAFDDVLKTEGAHTSENVVATTSAGYVTRIQIHASAATEYVAVYRGEDTAPLAVARGESLDLELPEGVGVAVEEDQPFRIVQRVRNEYWVPPGHPDNLDGNRYYNLTRGRVAVDLHVTDSVEAEATPFIDETGTDLMSVPPERLGATGGVWPGSPGSVISGALVGIWTDRRAITAGVADPATGTVAFDPAGDVTANLPAEDLRQGYATVQGTVPLPYSCLHNNGLTHASEEQLAFATTLPQAGLNEAMAEFVRPIRTSCQVGEPTAGLPRLLAEAPQNCVRSHQPYSPPPFSFGNDCKGIGTQRCVPGTLVGGPGVDDGRCALVGLWW